jgi:hypothetical protein
MVPARGRRAAISNTAIAQAPAVPPPIGPAGQGGIKVGAAGVGVKQDLHQSLTSVRSNHLDYRTVDAIGRSIHQNWILGGCGKDLNVTKRSKHHATFFSVDERCGSQDALCNHAQTR